MSGLKLSQKHIEAVNRRRRIINHYDPQADNINPEHTLPEDWVKAVMGFKEWHGHQIDTISWDIGEGNMAFYPSNVLEVWPKIRNWVAEGNDLLFPFIEKTRAAGLEVFFSYRLNTGSSIEVYGLSEPVKIKKEHPDWLIDWNTDPKAQPRRWTPWDEIAAFWNYAVPEVRKFRLEILKELAENYQLDGIQLDFARCCPVLPIGHQWEHREQLTDFVKAVREMLIEVENTRGYPFLLAVKVPENLEGCHFDGIDVETWINERLIDILFLGCRSLDVDLPAFRTLAAGTDIKLYPCHDCHHASDAYRYPPLEMLRGVCANWWRQGADGIQIFNYLCAEKEAWVKIEAGSYLLQNWESNRQAFREIGSPDTLRYKEKTFVVQRRAGGHPNLFGWPEEGKTQHWTYHNSNMLSPLPIRLGYHGHGHTLLRLYVGDDLNTDAEHVKSIKLRVLLSDPTSKDLAPEQCIEAGMARAVVYKKDDDQRVIPLQKSILPLVEVRLNNVPLGMAIVEKGWLEYTVQPQQTATGINLVSVKVKNIPAARTDEILIERLEMNVCYRQQ